MELGNQPEPETDCSIPETLRWLHGVHSDTSVFDNPMTSARPRLTADTCSFRQCGVLMLGRIQLSQGIRLFVSFVHLLVPDLVVGEM